MTPLRLVTGIWATPVAWGAVLAVGARAGRLDPTTAVTAALAALLGVGLSRAVAGSRGGLHGRLSELLLAAATVGWLLGEPASQRVIVAVGGTLVASALAVIGVWRRVEAQPRVVTVAGATAGVVLASGLVGGPWWPAEAVLIITSVSVTARLLCTITSPELAAAAVPALAVAIGAGHTLAWLLPLLVAGAINRQRRGSMGWPMAAAVSAAVLPPAGLALSVGLVVMTCLGRRSLLPLSALVPAAATAWWFLPGSTPGLVAPSWPAIANALHLSPTSLPLLLPAAVLAVLTSRRGHASSGLIAGLAVLPMVGAGIWLSGASAALWLLGLAASRSCGRALQATLPWTVGASLALLTLAPWGGARQLPWNPPWLSIAWLSAVALSLLPGRLTRLAWVLPAAGLVWTFPVEGSDRILAPGQQLHLRGAEASLRVLQIGYSRDPGDAGADEVLRSVVGTMAPLLRGHDCPPGARHALVELLGRGHATRLRQRAVSHRRTSGGVVLEAAAPVIVRVEDGQRWLRRRTRFCGLMAGALALLAGALVLRRARDGPLSLATGALLATLVAAGSGIAPLTRAAVLGAADAAAAVLLLAWVAVLPVLHRRRFVAGALLLLPIALAQPLLRPPAGDEVYHLQLLESLTADHDLQISNNLDPAVPAEAVYRPHADGLIHSPLPALLTLPGYLLLGHGGALALLALAMAGGAALAARHAERVGARRRAANAAWMLIVATYPASTFASQLWPAAVGVLLVGVLLAAAARPSPLMAALATAAALVVKVRLGLLALPLAWTAARRRARSVVLVAALAAAGLAAVALLLGGPLGRHRLASLVPRELWHLPEALWGLLFDGAGGLAFAAPLWLVALTALPALWRRGDPAGRALIFGAGLTVAALAAHDTGEWFGGGAPPARYLVPCLPLALLALSEALRRPAGRRLVRLALPWAAIASWVAMTRPLWLYNPVDGGWWLVDRLAVAFAGAARDALPSVLRPGPATVLVPVLIAATAWWWARRPRFGAAGAVMVGLLLVTAATAGGRERNVHAEDPQVQHLGGTAAPPTGTLHRARNRIGWRLAPGNELVLPWNPPLGHRLEAVVRLSKPHAHGDLETWWENTPRRRVTVELDQWHRIRLPRAPTLGRSRLHLRWLADNGEGALIVDRVTVER